MKNTAFVKIKTLMILIVILTKLYNNIFYLQINNNKANANETFAKECNRNGKEQQQERCA